MFKYRSDFAHRYSEADNFEHGCIGSVFDSSFKYEIEGDTLHELKEKITSLTGCDYNDLEVNCTGDEPNRIRAQSFDNSVGEPASIHEIEQWKKGEIELFISNWSFYFTEQIEANFNV